MSRLFVLFCLFVSCVFAGEIDVDLSHADPLTAAIMRGVEEAFTVNEQGLDALDRHNLDVAEAYFRQAVSMLPVYSDAMNNLGIVYFRQGHISQSKEQWEAVLAVDPDYVLAWYNLGCLAFAQQEWEEAKRCFQAASKKRKRFAQAEMMLARVMFHLGEKDAALKRAKKAWDIDTEAVEMWSIYSYMLLELGDTVLAETILKERDMHPVSQQLLGQLAAIRSDYPEARRYLEAAKINNDDRSFYPILASVYFDTDEFDAVSDLFRESRRKGDEIPPEFWNTAALAQRELGKSDQALILWREALKIYTDDVLRFNLAQSLSVAGKYREALQVYEELSSATSDVATMVLHGDILFGLGRYTEALQVYESAEKRMPEKRAILRKMVKVHFKLNDTSAAQDLLTKISLQPGSNHDEDVLLALLKNDSLKMNELKANLEQSWAEKTLSPDEQFQLVLLYRFLGEDTAALEILEKGDISRDSRVVRTYTEILVALGKSGEALEILEEDVTSYNTDDILLRAELLVENGRYNDARHLLRILTNDRGVDTYRVWYLKGYTALRMSRYDESVAALKEARRLSSQSVAARGLLAYVYQMQGNTEQAELLWRENAQKDSTNNSAFLNLAVLAEQAGENDSALTYYFRALQMSPDAAGIQVSVGNIYFEQTLYDSALVHFTRASDSLFWRPAALAGKYWSFLGMRDTVSADGIAIHLSHRDRSDVFLRIRSDYAMRKGNFAEAERLGKEIRDPFAEDYIRLVRLSSIHNKSAEMEDYLEKAERAGGDSLEIETLLAELAYMHGDYRKALSLQKGDDPTSRYNRILLQYKNRQYKTVLQEALLIVDLFEGNDREEIMNLAGNSAIQLKEWALALRWFGELYSTQKSTMAGMNAAISAYNIDDMETAWTYYSKVREQDSTVYNEQIEKRYAAYHQAKEDTTAAEMQVEDLSELDSLFNQAVQLHLQGDAKTAKEMYRAVLERDKRYYRAWNNLGALYGSEGDIEEAVECYENAVSRRADIVDGYINLVNIYSATGNEALAQRWLKRGLRVAPENPTLLHFKIELFQ